MAFFGCNLLGRAEGRSGAGGAVGGEELGDLEVALVARHVQRRAAILLGLVDRCAGLEEQLASKCAPCGWLLPVSQPSVLATC